jgi:hypothetical protein
MPRQGAVEYQVRVNVVNGEGETMPREYWGKYGWDYGVNFKSERRMTRQAFRQAQARRPASFRWVLIVTGPDGDSRKYGPYQKRV